MSVGRAVLTAVAVLTLASGAAGGEADKIHVQGNWAYVDRGEASVEQHLATTPAAEGDVWLILACGQDEKLTVSLIHDTKFEFPLKASSSVQLRSKEVPAVAVEGRSAEANQIVLDPRLMRHVMPSFAKEDQLVISVLEAAGLAHDYTFAMQPNNIALKAIRSHCFSD
jgi:hypothetical protein